MSDVRSLLDSARSEALAAVDAATSLADLDEARIRALGRKSAISSARGALRELSDDERKVAGQLVNDVQRAIEDALDAKRRDLESAELERRWESERIDVTLPGLEPPIGGLHPLTRTMWEIVDIFVGLGYAVAEGPEVELTSYEFDALNMPPEHPARAPQDTFYIAGSDGSACLRTQTSPMQIRYMEQHQPPGYVIVPGRTYRREDVDPTHLAQFAQLEGLAVDEGITMADLKGSVQAFARELFGNDLDTRLRPHHFPFTEPSAELDVQCFNCRGTGTDCRVCKGEGWIEVLGCGMVHPFLFEWVGYDPERYTGFAFGMGLERIAALAHGVSDIRAFYENDLRFLAHFGGLA